MSQDTPQIHIHYIVHPFKTRTNNYVTLPLLSIFAVLKVDLSFINVLKLIILLLINLS